MDQMARWGWLIPTVAVVALAAVVLLKGPAAAPAAAITEIGTGTVQVAPDTAVIQLGVMSTGANAQSAVTHNDTLMAAAEQAIESLGIPASDFQTINYNLYPQYHESKLQGGVPTIVGYNVSDTLQVTVSNLPLVDKVLSVGIASGANSIQSLQYEVLNQNAALTKAEAQAIAQAKAEAQTAASAMGRTLGTVISVEDVAPTTFVPYGAQYNAMATAGSPVQSGSQSVSVTVKVVWSVR